MAVETTIKRKDDGEVRHIEISPGDGTFRYDIDEHGQASLISFGGTRFATSGFYDKLFAAEQAVLRVPEVADVERLEDGIKQRRSEKVSEE